VTQAPTSATPVSIDQLVGWLRRFRDAVVAHRTELTELDSAIGDADHGSNMVRGLQAVTAKVDGASFATVDELFKAVGMTLVSSVGGASGPLYGTFFLRMGTAAGGVGSLDGAALSALLHAGVDGVVARGKAEAGDKTMIDAMAPAVDALDQALAAGAGPAAASAAASAAADRGRESTEPMLARKGRASYLGERSIGHIDPGAASTALLFRCLADELAAP
jgi:dihydroxyacetone kinase-like protein